MLEKAFYICEVPGCDADGETVHHFFKRSLHPEHKTSPKYAMAACGSCHSLIHKRMREQKNYEEMYPDRYWELKEEMDG